MLHDQLQNVLINLIIELKIECNITKALESQHYQDDIILP